MKVKNVMPLNSYINMRQVLGILGMALPLICYLGGRFFEKLPLLRSISYYYYFNVRDSLVGILIAVGVFMITYKGYEIIDDIVSNVIGIASIGIALFPCLDTENPLIRVGFFQLPSTTSNIIHLSSAVLFFTLLALNSIFLFTRSDEKKEKTVNKRRRNIIYIICGVIILSSIFAIVLLFIIMGQEKLGNTVIIFTIEAIMLEAFGISWLVKGETILKDTAPDSTFPLKEES